MYLYSQYSFCRGGDLYAVVDAIGGELDGTRLVADAKGPIAMLVWGLHVGQEIADRLPSR